MESREIYESNRLYLNKIKWIKVTDNSDTEWIYLGDRNAISTEVITNIINSNFKGDTLFIATTRNGSKEIKKEKIASKIIELQETTNFVVWDEQFQIAIEFNTIGTYRQGIIIDKKNQQ
jgi:hypothetical protein